MGGAKRKRMDKARAKRHEKAARQERWRTALAAVLSVLEWADADPSELRGALMQLPEILTMLGQAGEAMRSEEVTRLFIGLERCWKREAVPAQLRAAAWAALHEASLVESSLCEVALARGIHSLALSELAAAASASASSSSMLADGEAGDLAAGIPQLGFLWNICEALPEAAEALSAPDHVETVCLWATSSVESAALAALNLLLVLADGALDEPKVALHTRQLAASILVKPVVQEQVFEMDRAGPSSTCDAKPQTDTPSSPTLSKRRVLAAALILALPLHSPSLESAENSDKDVLHHAFEVAWEGACAPLFAPGVTLPARLISLEALSNAFALASNTDAMEGSDAHGGDGVPEDAVGTLPHVAGGAADALAARLAAQVNEAATEAVGRHEQAVRMRDALLEAVSPDALLLPWAAHDASSNSKSVADASIPAVARHGLLELLSSVLERTADRYVPTPSGKKIKIKSGQGLSTAQKDTSGDGSQADDEDQTAGPETSTQGPQALDEACASGHAQDDVTDPELIERLLHLAGSAMSLCASTGSVTPNYGSAIWELLLPVTLRIQRFSEPVQDGLLSLLSVLAMSCTSTLTSCLLGSSAGSAASIHGRPPAVGARPLMERIAAAAVCCIRNVEDGIRPAAVSLAGQVLELASSAAQAVRSGFAGPFCDASDELRESLLEIESELCELVSSAYVAVAVEAAAALASASRSTQVVRSALPRLRAALEAGNDSPAPVDAEAREHAVELLCCIENELGDAQWAGSA